MSEEGEEEGEGEGREGEGEGEREGKEEAVDAVAKVAREWVWEWGVRQERRETRRRGHGIGERGLRGSRLCSRGSVGPRVGRCKTTSAHGLRQRGFNVLQKGLNFSTHFHLPTFENPQPQ